MAILLRISLGYSIAKSSLDNLITYSGCVQLLQPWKLLYSQIHQTTPLFCHFLNEPAFVGSFFFSIKTSITHQEHTNNSRIWALLWI